MIDPSSQPWCLGQAWRNPWMDPTVASPSPQHPLKVAILGSTGSIGTQTLAVIHAFKDRFQVIGLAAGQQVDLLTTQANHWQPKAICLQSAKGLVQAMQGIKTQAESLEGLWGDDGLIQLATHPDIDVVIVGLVGLTGLAPTLAALKAGKRVITANKETFVAGGHLVAPYLSQLLPIDSEHAAIFQCLQGVLSEGESPILDSVAELILTASGGPFRTWDANAIPLATREQALAHPNWSMGSKVTVDSATLMNKGLEIIEAHWLFGLPYDRINVVIHPQSMVHSGVRFVDGSVLTQWGTPDMRVPIVHALAYPNRWPLPTEGSFATSHYLPNQWQNLTFETPDLEKFPALALARHAGEQGPAATITLNAADEVAVERFLKGDLTFGDLVPCVAATLEAMSNTTPPNDLDAVAQLDAWARQQARAFTPKVVLSC
ncbi:MAG: 1-deoxy-D-xylulose-5-phosphate reductoisomerase [Vampirovibrionales bacterium]|nr:1-deoxy-D-xylulose-5-phosphate reductoisomerase [Vampirovibrionales bacterium]